ncbi:MAG: type VI secretion system baseplate subunit TssF [Isosphaeraceae bacterium]
MPDDLLDYYNRELTFIRRLGAEFAAANPKIAKRLRLSTDGAADDPHVERLIEAFAYLTARIRTKLEDQFPELTASLLDVLYPHYLAPIPSLSIVQFKIDQEQDQLTSGFTLPRHTELETEPVRDEPCRFRTCYPVTLWPIELRSAVLAQAPLPAPVTPYFDEAAAVLRLGLSCSSQDVDFATLGIDTLRFFLKGQPHHVHRLYELLFNHAIGVVVTRATAPIEPLLLGSDVIGQVGFGLEEGLIPYPPRSFLGYRLLTEYFILPQKFLFVDFNLSAIRDKSGLGNKLVIYVYFSRLAPELTRNISTDTFQLGCTPIVNLFQQRADPISLSHTSFEYQVVPDRRRPMALEIYSIDRVSASSPDGQSAEFRPFFSIKHAADRGPDKTYWHASRRPAEATMATGDRGTELFLSLVDPRFQPTGDAGSVLEVQTTCLNRDLPLNLPYGGDQPRLQLREGSGPISRIRCLTPPTPTFRPDLGHGLLWRLISHLSLNHLSLVEKGGEDALREILKLYDFVDSAETQAQISGILSVKSRRVVGAVRSEGPLTFCRGVEVTLQFDEDRYTGSSLFLFASVLEHFLGLYCTLNSFTKLVATVKGREGELRRWPPRMGENVLV